MSRSEVMRLVLQTIIDTPGIIHPPEPKTERIVFRDPTDLLVKVSRRARRLGVTTTDLVEAAVKDVLR